ncbi:hypothetical protein ACFQ5J_10515 [Lacticaseibacillus baoqingensis]|uniref:Uncharacterized protein n=1 Tax=Lacticaseibacillus baoqingensis TaxID=2486013 RepID=A0ABW4E9J1_9LACO|nr:hypothetical protein [Lacticaseibacillus baoqingensis]
MLPLTPESITAAYRDDEIWNTALTVQNDPTHSRYVLISDLMTAGADWYLDVVRVADYWQVLAAGGLAMAQTAAAYAHVYRGHYWFDRDRAQAEFHAHQHVALSQWLGAGFADVVIAAIDTHDISRFSWLEQLK